MKVSMIETFSCVSLEVVLPIPGRIFGVFWAPRCAADAAFGRGH